MRENNNVKKNEIFYCYTLRFISIFGNKNKKILVRNENVAFGDFVK